MSLSLNARRKFKDTPAGSIPVEWGCAKFGALTRIAEGLVSPTEVPYRDYVHVGPENIESFTGRLVDLRTAAELKLESGKHLFDATAIVYSKIRPNLNKVCRPGFVGISSADAYPIWVTSSQSLDPDFLVSYMRSDAFLSAVCRTSMRTGMPKVNRDDLNSVSVPLPPLPEQRAIAGVLGDWDEAIRLHEDRLASLTERKRGLMQSLLTGRSRLPGFTGESVRMRHNHYFSAPSDWRHCHIHDIADEHTERNHGQQNIPVLSCTKHEGLVESLKYFGKQVFSDNTATYKVVPRNHFAYATNHIEEGSIGYQSEWDAALISPIYSVFKTRDGVHDAFLLHLVKSELYRKIFKACTNASVDRRGSLRWRDFSLIPVALPSVAEQRAIAAVLTACDEEIALTRAAADSLREQKRGLLQTLMSGRLRVPVTR